MLAKLVLPSATPSPTKTALADTHFYLKDGQGSTRTLVNASGSILNTYGYHAFGDFYLPQTAGTTPNNYLYTGQQYDALTGNYSLRARYYDPSDGRFLTQDTYPYNYQNPIELNRYGYTANNPINGYDPTGLFDYGVGLGLSQVPRGVIVVAVGAIMTALAALLYYLIRHLVDFDNPDPCITNNSCGGQPPSVTPPKTQGPKNPTNTPPGSTTPTPPGGSTSTNTTVPSPTTTDTSSPTPTNTSTPSPTVTDTPTSTSSPTVTDTATPTDTTTPSPTATPDCSVLSQGGTQAGIPRPIPTISLSLLGYCRPEALVTIALINSDGPFPYPKKDDTNFNNWPNKIYGVNVLPVITPLKGYYREYTVVTPGAPNRGARRIITGGPPNRLPSGYNKAELFYTDDHYELALQVVP